MIINHAQSKQKEIKADNHQIIKGFKKGSWVIKYFRVRKILGRYRTELIYKETLK